MDAHDDLTTAGYEVTEGDLAAVVRLYDRIQTEGAAAGLEEMLGFCHEDVEVRGYVARATRSPDGDGQEVLHGHDELRDFFSSGSGSGLKVKIRARTIEPIGDSVFVRGSIRVGRPDGSFAETKVSWRYRFRDGLVDQVSWEPRAGA
jgi:SnoaL-like domain